ncbi:FeoB-associated Cys-rich membrane protein [Candidatus Gracilibacteria bacterium]|nr:FeoB-associated Cys-rich membrane protein [Candidatus Gracilibacteria bacterium]MBS9783750.1 FeoB-associated Cys-rich membrane protein [Candidatus Gracilibacteria bacterium]
MNSFALSAASASLQFMQFCLKNEMTCKIIGWTQTIITGLIFILVFAWLIRYMIRNYKQEMSFKKSLIYGVSLYIVHSIAVLFFAHLGMFFLVISILIGILTVFLTAKVLKDELITLSFSAKSIVAFFILNMLIGMALTFTFTTLINFFF